MDCTMSMALVDLSLFLMFLITSSNCEQFKGSVVLDEVTFKKIIPKHEIVLVKFDQMYPWGDHLKEYKSVVQRIGSHDRILLAEVPVADFGEKHNERLAKSYGVKTKTYEYPQYRLFLQAKGFYPVEYKGNNNADDIMKFIILTTGTWLQLPGCIEKFDDLIKDFVNKTKDERKRVINDGERILLEIPDDERASANTYLKIMKRLSDVEGGVKERRSILEEDMQRTDKIMTTSQVHPEKFQGMKRKMNIIGSFFYNGLSTVMPAFDNDDIEIGDSLDGVEDHEVAKDEL